MPSPSTPRFRPALECLESRDAPTSLLERFPAFEILNGTKYNIKVQVYWRGGQGWGPKTLLRPGDSRGFWDFGSKAIALVRFDESIAPGYQEKVQLVRPQEVEFDVNNQPTGPGASFMFAPRSGGKIGLY